ncbi:MAG: RteC domain-containing protein [Bacteroidetes bacterium]|nr:RteC domain-containing protein [Bacteroidota bacterium]MBK8680391.1 RteC domain-containing protein [Bacteroidota bacterium]
MSISNYPARIISHSFKEHPIKNYLADEYSEFDLIGKQVNTIDFTYRGKFSDLTYCKALIQKFSEITISQLPEFIEYQLKLVSDKKQWLFDLEKLVETNRDILDKKRAAFSTEISNCLQTILNKSKNAESVNNLIWKGNDVDLLELIVALSEAKMITNLKGDTVRSEIIKIFEKLFGLSIKDANKKISAAGNRKRETAPFLTTLMNAYKNYVHQGKIK